MTTRMELEIDKFGRVLIPKKMREALNLRSGDKVMAQASGHTLTLTAPESKTALRFSESGWPVIDSSVLLPAGIDFVQSARDERQRELFERLGLASLSEQDTGDG